MGTNGTFARLAGPIRIPWLAVATGVGPDPSFKGTFQGFGRVTSPPWRVTPQGELQGCLDGREGGGLEGGEREEEGARRWSFEGLPFKPSLKGGFKGALKERGLDGGGGGRGRSSTKVKPCLEGSPLKGYPSTPPWRVTLEGLQFKFPWREAWRVPWRGEEEWRSSRGYLKTKGSFTGDRWTQLTLLVNIMSHTTLTWTSLSVSSAICGSLLIPAWVTVPENLSLHRLARSESQFIAQDWLREKISGKIADMDNHAVQAWKHVSARLSTSQQNDARSIKLRTTGSGWNI